MIRYDGWALGEPNDGGEGRIQDCACLWSSQNPNQHGRWDDETCGAPLDLICQKGVYNFILTSSRSNPGSAYVSCAVDVVLDDTTLSADDVWVSVGKNLLSARSIPYSSTNVNGGLRNNGFVIDNIEDDDQIFCHVALPGLTSSPSVEDISSTFVTVSWSSWIPCLDTGEGPVVSYLVYLQTMDGEWVEGGGIDSDVGEGDLQRRMEFVLTGLEPGNEYNISVSAVREGVGGEGPKGPLVSVTTTNIALPGLTSSPSVEDISSTFVTVSWSSWIPCLDTGEGPVVSYLVYLQTMDGEWVEGGGIDSDVGEGGLQRRMEFVLTGLEPGNEYNISVSAVREGVGGEGSKSPLVSVTTTSIESSGGCGALGKSNLIWILFGVSLAGNVLLLVVIAIKW
eukprot:XP_011663534.1 PREDICTED: uncharacterized protein LOC105437983 [Strongylocentrotus purpuratus]